MKELMWIVLFIVSGFILTGLIQNFEPRLDWYYCFILNGLLWAAGQKIFYPKKAQE